MNSTKSIEDINSDLPKNHPVDALAYLASHFYGKVKFSTSFGKEDQVLTHLISENHLTIDIFTLDTGRLFSSTYEVYQRTISKYKINITAFFPEATRVEKLISIKGPNSFYQSVENRKECCYIRKVEPLKRALENAEVWITGLMRDQSDARQEISLLSYDPFFNVIKCNPLTLWSRAQLENFISEHQIPLNSLHKQGYESIGCAPCTRAIEPGEHPRAGRWWWEQSHKECGIHIMNNS